jgi:hypothetical protein
MSEQDVVVLRVLRCGLGGAELSTASEISVLLSGISVFQVVVKNATL